jgi:hypothetical protein
MLAVARGLMAHEPGLRIALRKGESALLACGGLLRRSVVILTLILQLVCSRVIRVKWRGRSLVNSRHARCLLGSSVENALRCPPCCSIYKLLYTTTCPVSPYPAYSRAAPSIRTTFSCRPRLAVPISLPSPRLCCICDSQPASAVCINHILQVLHPQICATVSILSTV